ncbi:MAG: hypothetical protein PVG14_06555, partial [Anaerolineales bacterium]
SSFEMQIDSEIKWVHSVSPFCLLSYLITSQCSIKGKRFHLIMQSKNSQGTVNRGLPPAIPPKPPGNDLNLPEKENGSVTRVWIIPP